MMAKTPNGRGPQRTVWLVLLGGQALVAVAIVLLVRNRPGSSQVQPIDGLGGLAHDRDALLHEADMLQRRIHDWRRRATAADVHVDLDLGQSNAGAGSAGARFRGDLGDGTAAGTTAGSSNSLAVGGGGSASSGAGAGSSSGTCDPNGHPVTTVAPIDPQYLMRPAAEVEAENPEFAALLKKHSNDKQEIMLGLANAVMICQNATVCWWNGGNILESFLEILERSNISNHLIGVTDEETGGYLTERARKKGPGAFAINWFTPNVKIPESQANTREANRVSSLKFSLLQTSLQLGYHTMITDMDLVYLSDPFDSLKRDADIESSSDGFDALAYGAMTSISDATMGWGGGGLYMQTFTINVGCAFIRATHRAFAVVKRAADELAAQPGWDQQVFNTHLLTQSHGSYASPYATLRVMDIDKFVNSKRFFRSNRAAYIPGADATAPVPVMVHFNYHPDKHARMVCIMDRYFRGKVDACDKFPGGSEPGTR